MALPDERNESTKEIIAKPREDLVEQYKMFAKFLKYQPRKIYHPCCADDISPTYGFPNSHVIYADKDEKSITAIKKLGLDATVADATEFDPGSVDMVILLNPGISPDIPVSHLVEGGFVLCNDWHSTASDLHNSEGYEFIGGINRGIDGYYVDTDEPDDYWQQVENEDEWKKAKFSWGDIGYEQAANVVEIVTGKRENVMEEYMRIVKEQREELRKSNEELLAENPDMAEMLASLEAEDEYIFQHNGKTLIVSGKLPKKKGTTESILIFRKRSDEEIQTN